MKRRLLAAVAVLLALTASLLSFDTKPTPVLPDGTRIVFDLPADQHMQNVGGSDGAGLCVYTSITLGAKWQNTKEMYNLRKFAEGRPGGSYPEKMDADLKIYAKRYNVTIPNYVQHTGGDDAFLDLCIQTRRMPGITYAGVDDFYDSPILHMVNLAHLDEKNGAIQDNNRAGKWTSDTRKRILNRWKGLDDNGKDLLVPVREGLRTLWIPAGGGWAFVWLTPPPPPIDPARRPAVEAVETAKVRCGCWEREIVEDVAVWSYWSNGELKYFLRAGLWYNVDGQPIEPPEGLSPPTNEPTDDWNKGVLPNSYDRRNRYWINGVEVSRAKAYAAVSAPEADGLVDDSDRYHLSIVGPKVAIDPKYLARLHVQFYDSSDWAARDRLKAAVTLQEPAKRGGKVVGEGTDIKVILASVFDAPAPAPVVPKPVPTPAPEPKPVDPTPTEPVLPAPNWLLVIISILAALFLWPKK